MSEAADELKAKEAQPKEEPATEPQAEPETEAVSVEEEQAAVEEVAENLESAVEADKAEAEEAAKEAGLLDSDESGDMAEAPAETEEPAPEESAEPHKSESGMGDLIAVGIISLIVGILLCLPTFLGSQGSSGASEHDLSGGVAASVNGIEIGENDITNYVEGFRESADLVDDAAWGEWMVNSGYNPETLREQTIEYFVSLELLNQAVKEQGVEVPESEVDAQIAEIAEQLGGEDELEAALSEQGATMEEYRESILLGLQQEALQKKVVTDETTVDDAMVLEYLKMYYPEEVPEGTDSLEGVNSENAQAIRQWLEESMRQEAFAKWMEEYRASAEVTINDMPEGLPYAIDITPYEADAIDLAETMENPELTNELSEEAAPAEK